MVELAYNVFMCFVLPIIFMSIILVVGFLYLWGLYKLVTWITRGW